jgi:hypothetical protein
MKLLNNQFGGFSCGDCDEPKPVVLMVASVNYPKGCESCTRKAFAEALERALQSGSFDERS